MRVINGAHLRAVLVLMAAVAFVLFTYLAPDFSGYKVPPKRKR